MQKYIKKFTSEDFPRDLIISLLTLVMKINIFKFGATWWKQLQGTAMGTPCACIYAILFFGFYERTVILPKYKKIYYFIDEQSMIYSVFGFTTQQIHLPGLNSNKI